MDSPEKQPVQGSGRLDHQYFQDLYDYFGVDNRDNGGCRAVTQYLKDRDVSGFNPKAPPPMTDAKRAVINSGQLSIEGDFEDCFHTYVGEVYDDNLPPIFFIPDLKAFVAAGDFDDAKRLIGSMNGKSIHHKMRRLGYAALRHPDYPATQQWRGHDKSWRAGVAYYLIEHYRESGISQASKDTVELVYTRREEQKAAKAALKDTPF